MKINGSRLHSCVLALSFAIAGSHALAQRNPPIPAGLEVTSDIVYGNSGGRILRLDTVRSATPPAAPMPVILYIPGGGWSGGNRAGGISRVAFMAQRGYFCASMEHRGSNGAIFPAQIEDAKCAVRFLRSKAAEYNIDPNRIGVFGNSSGAHLAALLGTSGGASDLEGIGGHQTFSSRVQAVCNWFGPSDMVLMLENPSNGYDEVMRLLGGTLPAVRDLAVRASPIAYVTKDDPPFLLMHGDRDPVVPIRQSEVFQEKAVATGLDSEFFVVRGAGHGFQGPEYDKMAGDFFDKHLKATAPSVQPSTASRIVNLSIRTIAGAGAQTLIVGFAVGGSGATGSQPLLIRGVGPALGQFGVAGALADPQLQVFNGAGGPIAANDDWNGVAALAAAFTQVGAFALPSSSKDAAITATLGNAAYSAQISGAGNTTGVALAEIYDLTANATASAPRLVNVSARARVGDGDILITGFVIAGSGPKTIIIRAIGPTLAGFGVADTLVDPQLQLFQGASAIGLNNDWGGAAALSADFTRVGAFALPATSKDAALQVTLQPGSYSAQVSGVGNTSGVALVELYEVP